MYRCCTVLTGAALCVVATLAAACASTGGAAGRARRGLTRQDSTYLAGGPVYRDCAVDTKARLVTTGLHADYRPNRDGCYSAEVEFVVDAAGVPEPRSIRTVRTNDPAFAEALAAFVPGLKYEPARIGGTAVRQIVSERQSFTAATVLVPKGSPPPSRPNGATRPTC